MVVVRDTPEPDATGVLKMAWGLGATVDPPRPTRRIRPGEAEGAAPVRRGPFR